ncbi:MAG TPA: ATP-binding protein, partial [Actinomycetota bacterium]
DLEAFLEASRAAHGSAGNLEGSLTTILDLALGLVGGEEGSIMLMDETNAAMRIAAARGLPAQIRRETRIAIGRGIAGTVVQSGRALLLPTPLDVSRFEGYVEKTRPIHSALSVPLRARDRIIGVLNLNLMNPGQFDDEDLQVATLFAEHAALAVSGAAALAGSQRTAGELESLRAAGTRLGRTLDLDTVADGALTEALAIAGTPAGLLVLGDGTRVHLARYRGMSRDAVRDVLRNPGFAARLAASEPLIVRAVATDQVFAPLAADIGGHALIVAPLVGRDGEAGGVMVVALRDADDATAARLLAAYSAEAGLAIANAVLHEQVRVKEEELETIVEAMASPIVLVDQRGTIRAMNPAAAQTFHLTPEFEVGQSARGKLGDQIEELMLGQAEGTREIVLPVGGDPHVWRATVTTTRSGPVPGGRLLVLDDVTLQRELEQRKADFLAVIGHELRTPLTIIRGFATTLARRDLELDEQTRGTAVGTIMEQSERLSRLIEDLLYVSRIENRTPPLHLEWSDVVQVAGTVITGVREREPQRPLSLRNTASAVHLLFDRVKVEQVIRHLLDNAVKYSEPGTPITVKVDDDGDDVRITVEDKGAGIFSGDIPRLFRVFGQLDSSSTRRHGGTGVGLSVCRTLVEAMGGRIWAESMLGKGSEFSFTVPKTPPASERA